VFENPKANPTLETIEKGLNELGYVLEINVVNLYECLAVNSAGLGQEIRVSLLVNIKNSQMFQYFNILYY